MINAVSTRDLVVKFDNSFTINSLQPNNYLAFPDGVLLLLAALVGSGGAQGESSEEIADKILYRSWVKQEYREKAATKLYKSLYEGLKPSQNLKITCCIYIQQNLVVKKPFLAKMREEFKCSDVKIDFWDQEAARGEINEYIRSGTNGMIKDFIKEGELAQDTELCLISAIYFKDQWEIPFSPDMTQSSYFFPEDGKIIRIPLMITSGTFYYGDYPMAGIEMLKKEFKNKKYEFVIVITKEHFDTKRLDDLLTRKNKLYKFIENLKPISTYLWLPKFQMEALLDVKQILKAMKFGNIFDKTANFSGIYDGSNIVVGAFKQGSVLRLNEAGVEASSVSQSSFGSRRRGPNRVFRAQYPFACFIYDTEMKLPIFSTKVIWPKPIMEK